MEKIKSKNFILENVLIKKNNIIDSLKRKRDKLNDSNFDNEKETFVIEPTKAINILNNELLIYSESYESLNKHFTELKDVVDTYSKKNRVIKIINLISF